ncbi:TetR/AcrR family transcriptional regulator [Bacillus sp. FJAT-42315]|uniref:TetR/AcrR family transcriptional regulator n=1 Tax=Bacillus sp. FJAT-42315 TaxID=2014077 RepID=UPI000C246FE8|nr:TetR/AcrR family transcriptional regulator [Bacillus sp. FJAT-42315]
MAKFTNEEKEKIYRSLLEQGRQLFSTHGLKKTSIGDLTKAVGIAQGSYYLFFQSKEELYFAVLEQEEETIRTYLVEKYFSTGAFSKEQFREFLRESFAIMEKNPFIQQLHQDGLLETLFRKLPADKLEQHFADDSAFLLPFIQEAQAKGVIVQKEPETIVSLIRSIVLLSLQKEKIGANHYEETIELLIELVTNGLMNP